MLKKRILILAGVVSLPLFVGACATNDQARGSESSAGSSAQGSGSGDVRIAGGAPGFRTINAQFNYPNY